MIKKKLRFAVAPILILGLAACNNDNDTAMDVGYPNKNNTALNRSNVDQSYVNQVNYRGNAIDREGPLADDRDNYPFDHRGPLAENFRNRIGRNDRNVTINNDENISSMSTNQSSDEYPHTKPILTQEAKYKFTPVSHNQENRYSRWQNNQATENNRYARSRNNQYARQEQNQTERNETEQQQQTTPSPNTQQQTTGSISQYAQQVVDLTNEQRRRNGLPALQIDTQLSQVAQRKSMDMQQNGYFSHTSPTYGSPFDMMRDFGVSYRSAGENIAQGQRTPQEVVQAWMNSQGHRKNILSQNFTHIGVGYESSSHHWTQMFIGK